MNHIRAPIQPGIGPTEGKESFTAQDVRQRLWRNARRLVGLGAVGEAVSWAALLAGAPDHLLMLLAGVASVAAAAFTVQGVARGARAWDMRPAVKGLMTVLALLPVLRLIPVVAFSGRHPPIASDWPEAWQANAADAARQRSQARQDRRATRLKAAGSAVARVPAASELSSRSGADRTAGPDAHQHASLDSSPDYTSRFDADSEPGASAILWPAAADTVRQQALQRLSSAVPRIRLIDTEGLPDGALLPPERLMQDLNLPFDVDLSRLELPLTRATKGVFGVQYMVDDGQRYTPVVASDLSEAGLSVNDLHRLALDNLRRRVKEDLKLRRANPGIPGSSALRLQLDGYHETSALLLDDLWDKALKKHTPNGVVAVMPSRDVCTFIDLSALTQGGLAELREAMLHAKRLHGEAVNALLHRQGRTWALAGQLDGV